MSPSNYSYFSLKFWITLINFSGKLWSLSLNKALFKPKSISVVRITFLIVLTPEPIAVSGSVFSFDRWIKTSTFNCCQMSSSSRIVETPNSSWVQRCFLGNVRSPAGCRDSFSIDPRLERCNKKVLRGSEGFNERHVWVIQGLSGKS